MDNKKTVDIKKYKKEYMKNWNKDNKEKILEKKKCELCGGSYLVSNLSHHKNTKKHKFALLEEENKKLKVAIENLKDN